MSHWPFWILFGAFIVQTLTVRQYAKSFRNVTAHFDAAIKGWNAANDAHNAVIGKWTVALDRHRDLLDALKECADTETEFRVLTMARAKGEAREAVKVAMEATK